MTDADPHTLDRRELARKAMVRLVCAVILLGAFLFLSAGTLRYGEAWGYLGVWIVCVAVALRRLLTRDPALLERRLRARERDPDQRYLMKAAYPLFFAALLIPGLDERFGWSSVPLPVVVAADLVVIGAYFAFLRVLRENSFASRIIEVEKEQKVITTGPYRVVRHPLYAAVIVIYLATPLALGSFWGVAGMLSMVPIIILRIFREERLLRMKLEGYADYMKTTRWRLVPGVW